MDPLFNKLRIEMAIKSDRNMLPEWIEIAKLTSEKLKIYYDELILAGFNEEQSLQIVISHGIDLGAMSWENRDRGEDGGN